MERGKKGQLVVLSSSFSFPSFPLLSSKLPISISTKEPRPNHRVCSRKAEISAPKSQNNKARDRVKKGKVTVSWRKCYLLLRNHGFQLRLPRSLDSDREEWFPRSLPEGLLPGVSGSSPPWARVCCSQLTWGPQLLWSCWSLALFWLRHEVRGVAGAPLLKLHMSLIVLWHDRGPLFGSVLHTF